MGKNKQGTGWWKHASESMQVVMVKDGKSWWEQVTMAKASK
jgi:hypothetical protein